MVQMMLQKQINHNKTDVEKKLGKKTIRCTYRFSSQASL